MIFEDGTTIHGTEGTAFGFALMAINGAAQFTPVPLGPGESARLNAAGTALEAFRCGAIRAGPRKQQRRRRRGPMVER